MSKNHIVGQNITATELQWTLRFELREDNPEYPKVYIPMDDLALAKFDPWNCSEDEARSAMRHWLANDQDMCALNNPWYQYKTAIFINSQRETIENQANRNHGLTLMNCINWLFRYQLIAPQWLTEAFSKVCSPVFNLEVISWDTTLGKPVGRGVHQRKLDKIRERRKYIPLVAQFIQNEIRKTGNEQQSFILAYKAFPHLNPEDIEKYHKTYLKRFKQK